MGNFTMTPSTRAAAKRLFRGSRPLFVTDTGAVTNFDVMIRPDGVEAGTQTTGPFPARDLLAADEIEPTAGGVRIRTGIRWADLEGAWGDYRVSEFGAFGPIGTYAEANDRRGVFGSLAACVPTDDRTPVLSGVCFEADGTAWATDRYRLARVFTGLRLEGDPDMRVIVSGRLMAEVAKAKTWDLSVGTDYSSVNLNGLTITARNVEGNFPSVAGLMPNGEGGDVSLTVPVGEVLETIKALAVRKNEPVEFWSDATMLYQGAQVRLVDGVVNKASRIGVNPKFLTEILKPHGTKAAATMQWRSEEPQKPVSVTIDGEDDLRMILMPVRLP